MDSDETYPENAPITPTPNTTHGTKKRNSRNAIAAAEHGARRRPIPFVDEERSIGDGNGPELGGPAGGLRGAVVSGRLQPAAMRLMDAAGSSVRSVTLAPPSASASGESTAVMWRFGRSRRRPRLARRRSAPSRRRRRWPSPVGLGRAGDHGGDERVRRGQLIASSRMLWPRGLGPGVSRRRRPACRRR